MKRALLLTCLLVLSDAAAARTPAIPNRAGSAADPAPREGVFAGATGPAAPSGGLNGSEAFSSSLFAGLQFFGDWPGDAAPASYELWWSNLGPTRIGRPRPGMILVDQLGAAGSVERRLVVKMRATAADGATVWAGPWVASDASSAGVGELRLSAAGEAISGKVTSAFQTLAWEGSRDRPANAPTQEPERPAPIEGPRDLGPFRVSFRGLERPRGSAVVRAAVTIHNVSERVQYLASGTFRAILTDADGAAQERNQIWQGSGEPAQVFNSTPALQPDGELTVRFTFNPDIRELDRLVLMRGEERIEFDLAGR